MYPHTIFQWSKGIGLGFHAKPAFFCNILNDDLYVDALITELFRICLVVSKNLGEGAHFKMYLLVL